MMNVIEIIKRDLGFYSDFKAIMKNKKARNKFFAKIFLYVLGIFYVVLFMTYMLGSFDIFKSQGKETQFLMMGFSPFIMMTIFFVTPFIISKIYFSNEMKILLRLPIKHEDLLLSRIIYLIGSALTFSVVITIPVLIKYGIGMNKGVLFYLGGLLSIILLSVITVDILSIFVIFIMKYINRSTRLKSILKYISYVLFFVLFIGFQLIIQSDSFIEGGNEIIGKAGNYSGSLANYLPHLKMVQIALTTNSIVVSLLYMLGLIVLSVLLTYILIKLFSNMMIEGVLSANTIQNKKIKTKDVTRSTLMEIAIKDFKNIIKNGMYAINKLFFGLIMIIFMVVPVIMQISKEGVSISDILDKIYMGYDMIINIFYSPVMAIISLSILITIVVTTFIASGSEITSTTFSREGKNLWMMKIFPIKTDDQLLGRILASTVIIMIASAPILLIMLFMIRFQLLSVITVLITNIVVAMSMSSITLIIGILFVKADWDNPQEAIKGFQGMIVLVIAILLLFLMVFIPSQYIDFENISNNILYIPFAQLFAMIILGLISYYINRKLYEKRVRIMGN